jgi:hypothetical protein
MSYGKRRYPGKGRRSSGSFGGMVNDTAAIADRFERKNGKVT